MPKGKEQKDLFAFGDLTQEGDSLRTEVQNALKPIILKYLNLGYPLQQILGVIKTINSIWDIKL